MTEILDANLEDNIAKRRRKLLPWWIKTFIWIFLVFGAIATIGLIIGLLGFNFQLSLYGIDTYEPLSLIGLGLMGIFIFKGVTAFALWTEKDWAIKSGQIDAILGIAICFFMMFINPFIDNEQGFSMSFRLEFALLIPFLIKLGKIEKEWMKI